MQKTKGKRQKKQKQKGGYTNLNNNVLYAHIEGVNISLQAKGLYWQMRSLPKDWDFSVRGLASFLNLGRDRIQNTLQELEKAGLLIRVQPKSNNKFKKIQYTLIEDIDASNILPRPCCTDTGNPPQTNYLYKQKNNDKLKDKGLLDKPRDYKINNHILTNELIDKKVLSILDYEIEKFNELFKMLDANFDYKLVLKTTRYLIPIMKKQKKLDSKYAYFKTSIINNLKIEEQKSNRPPQKYIDFLKELEEIKPV